MRSLYLALVVIALFGCNKNSTNNAQYYVKYVVDGGAAYPLLTSTTSGLKVKLNNDKNVTEEYVRGNSTSYEFPVGPIKNGFTATLTALRFPATATSSLYIKPKLQIFVSMNNGPYVLKMEDMSNATRDSATISYRIQ
jgi:hypothetical protein